MKAVVMQGDKQVAYVMDRPAPKLRPGYMLIDVKAVALNPTDWKHVDWINTPGHLSGCDYAGTVADIGDGVDKTWKKGDRVCGFVHGGNRLQQEDGAFAEQIQAKAGIQIRIPDNVSFEEAATFGVAIITVGQGMYKEMGLNWPNNPTPNHEPILIYGGSSAMGTMGIQFAKLSGYNVITTCSPRNFDLVKSLGASAAFDYKDPECAEKIKKYTKNNLKLIWDTISLEPTTKLCSEVIAPGGVYGTCLNVKWDRDDVKMTHSLGYRVVGEAVDFPSMSSTAAENKEEYEFTRKFVDLAEQLFAEGKLKGHPQQVNKGLENVIEGLDLMRNDKVSGQKLVYVV